MLPYPTFSFNFFPEYIEAALGGQRKDLINAAAIPQIPLPSQTMRINQNSGLRR